MLDTLLAKVVGTQNERELKRLRPLVAEVGAFEPAIQALSDEQLRAQDGRVPRAAGGRRNARRPAARGVRRRPRSRPARAEHAPLRRAAHRRRGASQGQDRRDEDRRGQDARRHAARLSERARGQGRPRRDRERLPGPPRLGVDGPHLPLSRHDRRRHPARPQRRRAAGRLRRRHHLRDEQRVRVRLPARQHEVRARALRAARAPLRHRRRGGQHPHRRSADAAHHLGPGRGIDRPLLRGRSHHPAAEAGRRHARRHEGRGPRGARGDRRLHRRREAQDRHADRERHGQGRADAVAPAAGRRALRSGEHAAPPPRQPGAARATCCSSATSTTW